MKLFLKIGSYLFHPLWMPFVGALSFFLISPRFFPISIIEAKLLAIAILTIFIPIIFFFLLKNLKFVSSIELKKAKERKLPLLFFILLISTIINYILGSYYFGALFYFFSGILVSSCIAFFLVFLQIKASLHMIGICGLFIFILSLSIVYETNLTYVLSLLLFCIGWVASARLQVKAHTNLELILGILIGALPQFGLLFLKQGIL